MCGWQPIFRNKRSFCMILYSFGQSTIIERLWEGETRNGGFNYTDQPSRKQIQVHHNEISLRSLRLTGGGGWARQAPPCSQRGNVRTDDDSACRPHNSSTLFSRRSRVVPCFLAWELHCRTRYPSLRRSLGARSRRPTGSPLTSRTLWANASLLYTGIINLSSK